MFKGKPRKAHHMQRSLKSLLRAPSVFGTVLQTYRSKAKSVLLLGHVYIDYMFCRIGRRVLKNTKKHQESCILPNLFNLQQNTFTLVSF